MHLETRRDAGNLQSEWLLELTKALHTTLEPDELIRICSAKLQAIVPHTALEFREVQGRLSVRVGDPRADGQRHDVLLLGQPLGELVVSRERPFTERETRALDAVIANLAHPLRNALLYREALNAAARDPLTGVNNRAGLEAMLEREVGLARRYGTPLSLAMLDVDRFKEINDAHGHLAGDRVLAELARRISRCVRDSDLLFRYGGEEFLIVLSNTPSAGAALLAERIRSSVAEQPIRCRDATLALTVSLGVASLGEGEDHLDLLGKADRALYQSKARGRNRVTVIEAPVHLPADAG